MKNKDYIKSPINYNGNKFKLLPQIIPLFPSEINTFADIFGGSGTVLINTPAKKYVYNDVNHFVAEIFRGLVEEEYEYIIEKVEDIIKNYSLSKTNKEGFEKLREDYNSGKNDWITLYTLMCHSFNHQYRFNSKHEYNASFGSIRAYFSERQKLDLWNMKNRLKRVLISCLSFQNIDYSLFTKNDLVYFDPPYLNSVGNYNDGKRGFEGWNESHEKSLLCLLDNLNNSGVRFALSNNFKYNNEVLKEWSEKYIVHHLYGDNINCNYHKKDRSKDDEVLIVNY